MEAFIGIILTLGLAALAARSLVTAIQDRRPFKAVLLILVIIVLLTICSSGGYLQIDKGFEVDVGG